MNLISKEKKIGSLWLNLWTLPFVSAATHELPLLICTSLNLGTYPRKWSDKVGSNGFISSVKLNHSPDLDGQTMICIAQQQYLVSVRMPKDGYKETKSKRIIGRSSVLCLFVNSSTIIIGRSSKLQKPRLQNNHPYMLLILNFKVLLKKLLFISKVPWLPLRQGNNKLTHLHEGQRFLPCIDWTCMHQHILKTRWLQLCFLGTFYYSCALAFKIRVPFFSIAR